MTPSGWAVDVGELSGKPEFVVDAPYIQSIAVFGDEIWVGGFTGNTTMLGGQSLHSLTPFLLRLDRSGKVLGVRDFGAPGPGNSLNPMVTLVTPRGSSVQTGKGLVGVTNHADFSLYDLAKLDLPFFTCKVAMGDRPAPAIALQGGYAVVAIAEPMNSVECGGVNQGMALGSFTVQAGKLGIVTLQVDTLGSSTFLEGEVSAIGAPQVAIEGDLSADNGVLDVSALSAMMAGIVHYRLVRTTGMGGWSAPMMVQSSGDKVGATSDQRLVGERIAGGIGTWATGVRTNGSVFVSPFDKPETNLATNAVVGGTSFRSIATRAPNVLLVGGHVKTPALLGSTNIGCPGDGCASLVLLESDGTVLAPHTFLGKAVISAVTFDPTEATPTKAYVAGTFVGDLDVAGNKLTSATEHLFVAEVELNVPAP